MKKRRHACVFAYLTVALVYLGAVFIYRDYILNNSDVGYLLNRARQMLKCLSDGRLPWFYYDDFFGMGYGSSFFYGQMTLYPFLPVLALSEEAFVYSYIGVCVLVNFWGARTLFSRFGENADYMTLVYLASSIAIDSTVILKLYANAMGTGLCFFFLAFCIDFFRDGKSSVPASVTFFFVLHTHFLSAVLGFAGCVGIMLYYFGKERIKEYLRFAGFTLLICSYYIANAIYHLDSVNDTAAINRFALGQPGMEQYVMAAFPFGESVQFLVTGNLKGTALCGLGLLGFFLYRMVKGRKTRTAKQWMVLILCTAGIVCGTKPVWNFITGHFGVPFIQFPVRYMPYVMAVLVILLLSRENSRRVQAASLLYAVLYQISYVMLLGYLLLGTSPPDAGGLEGMKRYDSYYVGNGEYVSGFCLSPEEFGQTVSHVADEGGNYYAYVREKDRLVVSIDKQKEDIRIQIPKIYYHGYKAVMDDGGSHQELACTKGYSSLINVTVPAGSGGLLSVYYAHPPWLIALDGFCIFVTCIAFIRYINHQLRRKNNLCGKRKDCGC